MSTTSRSRVPASYSMAAGAVAFIVVGVLVWLWGAQLGHIIWSLARVAFPSIVAGILVGLLVYLIGRTFDEGTGIVAGVVGFVVGLVGGLVIINGYLIPHQMAGEVKEQAAESMDFRQRAPYDVATAVSNRNLGETTGDTTGKLKSVAAEGDTGIYTVSVKRRGMFKGYETTQTLNVPLYGSTSAKNVKFCEFSENAGKRLGGAFPKNNLNRAIQWRTSPSTRIDSGDALVHCEDGTPMVYVPLTKLDSNPIFPKRVPAGVAVYNGKTGELAVKKEIDTDLPLYPQSLAEQQRESLTRSGSFFDWMFKRSGFEDTSKDEKDPNGANRAEFGLASGDGSKQYYVTPLTSRGSSSSIIALGTIESDGVVKTGERKPYVVNRYQSGESRQANSAVASRITGEVLSGYRAAGLTVFEVIPSEDGTWTATVGKEQSVLYRAVIHPDGTIELLDAKGNPVAGDGDEKSEDGKKESTITTDKPLDDMSNDELKELGDQVLEELASRSQDE